jgi:hypothetical protein
VLRWVWDEGERPTGYFVERRPAVGGTWTRLTPRPLTRIRDRAAARAVVGERFDRYAGLLFPEDPRAELRDAEMFRGMLLLSADIEPGVAHVLGVRFDDVNAPAGVAQVYRLVALTASGERLLATSGSVSGGGYRGSPGPETVVALAGPRGTALRWKAAPRFSAYHVFRGARRDGSDARQLNDAPVVLFTRDEGTPIEASASFFTDTLAIAGDSAFYFVSGVDAFGRVSRRSMPAGFGQRRVATLATPVLIQTRVQGDTVVIAWTPPADPGVTRYQLWRAPTDSGPFVRVGTPVRGREHRDPGRPARRMNWYRVTAMDDAGRESDPSTVSVAEVPDLTPPATPDSVVAQADTGRMTLRWRAVAAPDLRGYRLYRSPTQTGTFALLSPEPRRDTRFVDTIPTRADHPFYYRVTAVDSSFNESKPSAVIVVRPPDLIAPSAPKMGAVRTLDGAIVVTWSANPEPDVVGYRVRFRQQGGAWSQYPAMLPATQSSDTISDLEPGAYALSVIAIDDAGNSSPPATPVERTLRRRALERPDLRRASYQQRERSVAVSWSQTRGVTHWMVLRREDEQGLRPVAELPQTATQFVDRNVRAGHRYEYVVRARDQFGNTSESRPRVVEIPEARP